MPSEGMIPLARDQYELFAHIVASGNPPELAHYAIDTIGEPGAARALARIPHIAARISYLKGVYAGG